MLTQEQLEAAVLRALFDYAQVASKSINAEYISALLDKKYSIARVEMALSALARHKLVMGYYSTISPAEYEITEKGYKQVEANFASMGGLEAESTAAPAADRIVRFNDNSAPHAQASGLIEQVFNAVSGDNALPAETQSRLSATLKAALILWQAAELKYIQIKIGIIMALEEVTPWAKEKFYDAILAGAIALIKDFVRSRLGLQT